MTDGELVTVVLRGPDQQPEAGLWRGCVDNDFTRLTDKYTSPTFICTPPVGCFGFNGVGTLCYVREADEGAVWVHGHVTEQDEAGAAMLAAWHMGRARIVPPWRPLPPPTP